MHRFALFLILAFAVLFSAPGTGRANAEHCTLTFSVAAENTIGTVNPSDALTGSIDFTVRSAWQQDAETVSYKTSGTLRLAAAGRGEVTGAIKVVHVVRTPYTADYISIDAVDVKGDLGGQERYADPMLVTLYAAPVTLTTSALPKTNADWNVLSKRRFFQVHTPTTMATFYGPITRISGNCR